MPGKVKVRILAGRNLPVMDKSSDTSDAFVEVKLGNTTYKTEVFRRSLNPFWNSEWFRFEVDDEELQDEPLQIRIMDYDTYSANDAIGKVYIDLNPLLNKDSGHLMTGWFPIYDTMHGIRGEVNCVVKIDLFSDTNRFRQSSCGVRFFYSPGVPMGYSCQAILGFVEELVVNDDPEYQWIDKIRTPRASNEARQTLFSKLSGEVQRKIGLKALELGGNCVLGYQQFFDLEGESGLIVRGIGTAVYLAKVDKEPHSEKHHRSQSQHYSMASQRNSTSTPIVIPTTDESTLVNADENGVFKEATGVPITVIELSTSPTELATPLILPPGTVSPLAVPVTAKMSISGSPSKRRSSDPDLSTTPKCGSSQSSGSGLATSVPNYRFSIAPESLHLLEYPFITMKQFPNGLIQHIGGVVSSRSVKLLDQINNPEEPETRDAWWTELRKEIRSHCRALGCNAVLGYCEYTHICDEVVILSASGTAVTLNVNPEKVSSLPSAEKDEKKRESELKVPRIERSVSQSEYHHGHTISTSPTSNCVLCHIPYQDMPMPFPTTLIKCSLCKKASVPDILFMTIEPPSNLPITGIGCLIQARVCRSKRDTKGEYCAKEISDSLPFLEYELHRQLMSKLRVKGMNALFELSVQISVGENMLVAIATGTGAYVACLPTPQAPKISSGKGVKSSKLVEIQKLIQESVNRNREHYGLTQVVVPTDNLTPTEESGLPPNSSCAKELFPAEKSNGVSSHENGSYRQNKNGGDFEYNDSCLLLEVDDTEDADIISLMIDSDVPKGYEICNTESLPGMSSQLVCNMQTFIQVFRAKLAMPKQFGQQFDWIIQSIFVKLRRLIPCCLTGIRFKVDLPEPDLVLVTVLGTAIGIGAPRLVSSHSRRKRTISSNSEGSELMFVMDEDNQSQKPNIELPLPVHLEQRKISHSLPYHQPATEHFGIEVTPLCYIPGSAITQYLGNLDFFFIRESSSIRESGGLNGFMHSFLTEVLGIVRAHVSGLGGNAMTSLHLTQCVLFFNPHKNQAQCLINVAGDAVIVQYAQSVELQAASQ
ncbi:C2 domain-containing protein 5 [Halotydeus destructor]|nr:C2 domain-containing protein 5 [Halotydeus destructor]